LTANTATITENSPAARTEQLRSLVGINAKLRRQYHTKGLTILSYRCGLIT
jgi:hypothetical protein